MNRLWLLLATSVALAGCAATPPASDPEQSFEMRFGWQPGFETRVDVTRESAINDAPVATSRFAYTMSAVEHDEHLLIESRSYDLGDPQPIADEADEGIDHLAAVAGSLRPGVVVGRDGRFVDVAGLDEFRQRVHRVVAERYPADGDPRLSPLMEMLTSETYVRNAAETEWRLIVATVAGRQFVPGRVYRFAGRQPATWLPGAPEVLLQTEMMLRETSDCERAGRPRTCAEFEMRWRADPDDVERLIAELAEQVAVGPDIPRFEHLAMENVLVLVTEPDGLYPHRYEINKFLAARYRDRAGQLRDDQRRERTRAVFKY